MGVLLLFLEKCTRAIVIIVFQSVSKLFPKEEARGIKGYLTVTDTAISIRIDAREHALSLCLHVCLKYPDSH